MNNALFVVNAMDGGVAMCAAEGSSEAEARRLARLLASVLYPTICRNFTYKLEGGGDKDGV